MTQISGIYCSYCRRRYVYHMCKNGMPCEHEYCEPVKRMFQGEEIEEIRGDATLIQCFCWRYGEGFRRFEMKRVYWLPKDDKPVKEYRGPQFSTDYADEDMVVGRFLLFLEREVQMFEWPAWVEAFVGLVLGGSSSNWIPGWRFHQLQKKRQQQESLKSSSNNM